MRRPRPAAVPPPAPRSRLRVRMYDVGFGDCFLLLLPAPEGRDRKVLIDCGSFKAGRNVLADVVGQVISDVTDDDGVARIDLLVATHRHKDHISGFADPRWDKVEVGEVWMPWTESDEPEAREIARAQSALALALHSYAQAAGAAAVADAPVLDLNVGTSVNGAAMERLRQGFRGRPRRRYLPTREASTRYVECAALSDIRIQVLGPSRDRETIFDMNPPSGEGYLALLGMRAASLAKPGASTAPEPFGRQWIDPTPSRPLDAAARSKLRDLNRDLPLELATALDKAINNTSLMLLFSIGEAHLLFPGDAQWGTWREVLKDPELCRLLEQCCFYKVGHHGSHNATPISFVSRHLGKQRQEVWAMVPVTSYSKWPDIPRAPLIDALKGKVTHFVRSDGDRQADAGFRWEGDLYVEAAIPIG
ncbi:hypothetical protein ASG52_22630 [Methylobacterium sp. Leaf456]|nr:hypothetical protein ASG52_22630 [Methylobacterium sp. Leaf456]